jgi:hypothetical protein
MDIFILIFVAVILIVGCILQSLVLVKTIEDIVVFLETLEINVSTPDGLYQCFDRWYELKPKWYSGLYVDRLNKVHEKLCNKEKRFLRGKKIAA